MTNNPAPERLSFTEADTRLEQALDASFEGHYDNVLLFDGDLVLEGDFSDAVAGIGSLDDVDLVVITGDLTVSGPIALYASLPGLYVGGTTRAETLEGGDCEIYIQDGTFTYLVYGDYNSGILETCTVETPWVINFDHDLRVDAPGARVVDNCGDDDEADFGSENIVESFVAEVVDPEYESIKVPEFLERLRAGLPVLRPGARTANDAALAYVARARADRVLHLDLSERKLKEFPAEVLRMPWLRTLVLDGNPIERLPDEIGTLTDLEVLSVRGCDLAELPASIGRLSRLRVLRIAHNTTYDFSTEPTHRPIRLPDTIGRLTALEELDVSELSSKPSDTDEALPDTTTFALPETAGNLIHLRRLVADQTNLVFPASMQGLASLEEISMAGQSWMYLKRFPEALTSFPNLRKLELKGNFFQEVPATLLRLTNLEELGLDNALGLVKTPLPDLSRLPRLRVLKLSGITHHAGVPVPPHELLRPVLANPLPALEELEIDRWGAADRGGRGPMTADVIAGIGAFQGLKRIDLSCNGLTELPDGFFTLPAVEQIDLRYNALSREVRRRVAAAYPGARIDFRDQRGVDSDSEREQATATGSLITQANALRGRGEWSAALAEYDKAIAQYTEGDADSAYGLLYAYYGKMWIHGKVGHGDEDTEQHRAQHRRDGVAVAETCMRLVPPVWQIFHFTDEGQFQREVVRYATNFLAWEIIHAEDPAPTPKDLADALRLIEKGVACADGDDHLYLHDTYARVLLALGRESDAWREVQRALAIDPAFAPLQDLRVDHRYQAWADRGVGTGD
ncbi:leucine-rich repeat domain-containing protein [Streptomyces atratus]